MKPSYHDLISHFCFLAFRFISIQFSRYILVGSNGLEPSTSRLSGVRSNHLSYEPISVAVCGSAIFRPTCVRCTFCTRSVSIQQAYSSRCRFVLPSEYVVQCTRNASGATGGGDEQNRTVDPLLARQVLSQLSYTPMFLTGCHLPLCQSPLRDPEN